MIRGRGDHRLRVGMRIILANPRPQRPSAPCTVPAASAAAAGVGRQLLQSPFARTHPLAPNATVYKSSCGRDIDRHYYALHNLTLSQHPRRPRAG